LAKRARLHPGHEFRAAMFQQLEPGQPAPVAAENSCWFLGTRLSGGRFKDAFCPRDPCPQFRPLAALDKRMASNSLKGFGQLGGIFIRSREALDMKIEIAGRYARPTQ